MQVVTAEAGTTDIVIRLTGETCRVHALDLIDALIEHGLITPR
jgi:hypothetical protein